MDFARIDTRRDAENGATYHVMFITDSQEKTGEHLYHDGEPVSIDLLGIEGNTGKAAAARMVKELDAQNGSKKRTAKNMSVDEILQAAEGNDEIKARFYAGLTTGWSNIFYLSDEEIDDPKAEPKELKFTADNAFMLYSTRPWIMEGIDAFLADKMNFMRKVVNG